MDFGLGGGASAQLKCVWARKYVWEAKKNYPVPTTRSMLWRNFLWGLRNWLHNKAE